MKFLIPFFVSAFTFTTLAACGSKKDSPKTPPPKSSLDDPKVPGTNSPTVPDAPKNENSENKPALPAPTYNPMGGDEIVQENMSRSYSSTETRVPEFGTPTTVTTYVVGRYAAGLSCGYRVKNTYGTMSSYADMRCTNEIEACGSEAKVECKTTNLGTKTIGNFANATGVKNICRFVSETAQGKSLTLTDGEVWTHPDALTEANVVRSEIKSCTLDLKNNEDAGTLDACKPTAGRVSKISEMKMDLKSQKRGAGKPDLTKEAMGKFLISGESDSKSKITVSCAKLNYGAAGSWSLNLSQRSCVNSKAVDKGLFFQQLPSGASTQATIRNSMLRIADQTFLDLSGNCKATYKMGEMIEGTISCSANAFKNMQTNETKSVTQIQFACFKPE